MHTVCVVDWSMEGEELTQLSKLGHGVLLNLNSTV